MKKFLALALSLLMVVSLVPMAFAAWTQQATYVNVSYGSYVPTLDGVIDEGYGTAPYIQEANNRKFELWLNANAAGVFYVAIRVTGTDALVGARGLTVTVDNDGDGAATYAGASVTGKDNSNYTGISAENVLSMGGGGNKSGGPMYNSSMKIGTTLGGESGTSTDDIADTVVLEFYLNMGNAAPLLQDFLLNGAIGSRHAIALQFSFDDKTSIGGNFYIYKAGTPTVSSSTDLLNITATVDGKLSEWTMAPQFVNKTNENEFMASWASYDDTNLYIAFWTVTSDALTYGGAAQLGHRFQFCLDVDRSGGSGYGNYNPTGANDPECITYGFIPGTQDTYGTAFTSTALTNLGKHVFTVADQTDYSPSNVNLLGTAQKITGSLYEVKMEVVVPRANVPQIDAALKGNDATSVSYRLRFQNKDWGTSLDYTFKPTKPAYVPPADFTVNMSGVSTADIGDTIPLNLNVTGNQFNSADVTLTFDSSKLNFVGVDGVPAEQISVAGNTIHFSDFGAVKTGYVLRFTAAAEGAAAVTVTEALFSTADDALTEDLTPAALGTASLNIAIAKKELAVAYVLPTGMTKADFLGADALETITDTLTFTATQTANYNYTVSALGATLTDNGNGTYTLSNPSGPVTVTVTPTAKTYGVTITTTQIENPDGNADDIVDSSKTATYGQDFTFEIPANVNAEGAEPGHQYRVVSVTIGETPYTEFTNVGTVYTIKGTAITGAIAINIEDKVVIVPTFSATVEGANGEATVGTAIQGEDLTLTLTAPDAAYTYTVTAVVGGETVPVTPGANNTYTVAGANVTGNVVFNVTKALNTTSSVAGAYMQLNGTKLYLVTIEKLDGYDYTGKAYFFDGQQMFWSDEYNAYAALVEATPVDGVYTAPALDKFTLGTAEAEKTVDYTGNVNCSAKRDANDAQLIYNIYAATEYTGITEELTAEKFLRADVNHDGIINLEDAQAVISSILQGSAQ